MRRRETRPPARALVAGIALGAAVVLATGCGGDETDDAPDAPPDEQPDADEPDDATPDSIDVTIPTADLELAGSLYLPDGEGPHVGIVIAHGSGPVDAAGTMRGQLGLTFPRSVQVYDELAVALTQQGYAVLTWDKRTCGPFNGCSNNDYPGPDDGLTIETLSADVSAAVDLLADRDDIAEVAVFGHSKGGTLAIDVADRDDAVAAVVLYGTPLDPIDEVLPDQAATFADLVEAAGQAGIDAADREVAAVQDMADQVASVRAGDVDGPPIGGASRVFWASWIEASDGVVAAMERLEAPVLVLGGQHDWNVSPDRVRAWEPHLRDGDRLDVLQGLTHAMTRLDDADPVTMTLSDIGMEVDPSVPNLIRDWLEETLAP